MSDYDVLIKNGLIVDGSGVSAIQGSIAIKGERISSVGEVKGTAEKEIDAKGFVVTPGWIDVHNHGDMTIIYYPKADGYLRQGITTFVGGNCGSSPGPYGDLISVGMGVGEIISNIAPDMYYPNSTLPREVVNLEHKKIFGWEIDWRTLGEFFTKLEIKGLSPNYVPLLGHHAIRTITMGLDSKRKATPQEVKTMTQHVEQAMIDGCRGMSAGRDYEPSYYADLDELVELNKIVSKYGGIYSVHCLRTGLRKARRPGEHPPSKVAGLLESIDVGRKSKVSVQISHLGALHDVSPMDNRELMEAAGRATIKIVDDAIKEGIDVSFDLIPGIRGFGTSQNIWLVASLTPWLKVCGGKEQLSNALRMKEFREEIKATCWSGKYYGLNPNINPNWSNGINILEHKDAEYKGKTIAAIAKEKEIDPFDALFDAIVADPEAKVGSSGTRESPTKSMFYKHPKSMIGIDTLALDTTWIGKGPPWSLPSENSFNGWAQYWQSAVREQKILTLEQAVQKATSLPASKFKIKQRGLLKEGYYADVVVFDLNTIKNNATPLNPSTYPQGIKHVLVNGQIVVHNEIHTGALPGKVLKRE
ncbi:amidohydrolase family protein [Candidatus Bathyarchaeota archaeon]|nr:amidohydrolase family protein [Candidatus Bathyarchaeota archaeon]